MVHRRVAGDVKAPSASGPDQPPLGGDLSISGAIGDLSNRVIPDRIGGGTLECGLHVVTVETWLARKPYKPG
jgi:hypothetical protein